MLETEREVYTETGYEKRRVIDGFFSEMREGAIEVEPRLLEGSPDSGRIVAAYASGSSFYLGEGGECIENHYDVGPIIARNMQSAFSAMFGMVKRQLTLESCRLYELDRDYSETEPEEVFDEKLTSELFRKMSEANGKLDDGSLARDYIAELVEFDEEKPAFKSKLGSKELNTVASEMLSRAQKDLLAQAPEGARAVSDPGAEETLKSRLAKNLTMREIKLMADNEASEELWTKANAFMPKIKLKTSFFARLFGKK